MRYTNDTDESLMQHYANGDVRAFEALYARHKDPLYRYFVRQIYHKETANDLYQELWGRIIKSADTYNPSAKWTTWAYRIAHNLIIDFYRTFKTVEPEVEALSTSSPHAEHEQGELSRQLLHCMEKLPATQREVFLLSQETDLKLNMIADVVMASHEAVKTRLRYARAALKQCLSNFGIVSKQGNETTRGRT